MQQQPSARVTLALARQIALREGVKAIVDGDVTLVGSSYIVATRLVTADSGRELASFRGTAASSNAIIDVADELSRKLRAKVGRIAQAREGDAAARLCVHELARRATKIQRGCPRERRRARLLASVRLLREAVALDSNFAEGWRKLTVAIRNTGAFAPSVADSAITRAYQLRDRMTERERDAVLAYYYSGSPGFRSRKGDRDIRAHARAWRQHRRAQQCRAAVHVAEGIRESRDALPRRNPRRTRKPECRGESDQCAQQ